MKLRVSRDRNLWTSFRANRGQRWERQRPLARVDQVVYPPPAAHPVPSGDPRGGERPGRDRDRPGRPLSPATSSGQPAPSGVAMTRRSPPASTMAVGSPAAASQVAVASTAMPFGDATE